MFSLKIIKQSRLLYSLSAAIETATNTIKRNSSNYKRKPASTLYIDQLQTLKVELFEQKAELSITEWEDLRNNLITKYKHINSNTVDAVIVGLCGGATAALALAKSYMHYLNSAGITPNRATLGRLIRIYNKGYYAKDGQETELSSDEQQEILNIYARLRDRHDTLDATTCENLICGLVCTKEWRKGLELLEMMRLTRRPSSTAFTELTIKAFSKGRDLQIGWQLLEETVAQRKEPKCEVYIAYLKHIANEPANFETNFEKLLHFLEQNELVITEKVAKFIVENLTARLPVASLTQIGEHGKCANCGKHMKRLAISAVEYAKLSNSFLNKVLIRSDIFQKSTPEEIERFKRFITQTAPYDCVIDGLNVAYSAGGRKQPKMLAALLANVVKHFKNQGKHLLVLGRMHMNNWPKEEMLYIRRNAKLFLTNNLSQDDPFLLYATLKSGQSTDFCSRDMMRSHAYLLGNELKSIFRRWQQQHQHTLIAQSDDGRIIIKKPIGHLICAHKIQDTWHVPYKQSYSPNPADTFEVPESWLCIKFNKRV